MKPSPRRPAQPKRYVNVMEQLVHEEFERQYARLPERLRQLVDCVDVEAWALSRLPARYGTSAIGVRLLLVRLQDMYSELIEQLVRQGIEVVVNNLRPPGEPYLPIESEQSQPVSGAS